MDCSGRVWRGVAGVGEDAGSGEVPGVGCRSTETRGHATIGLTADIYTSLILELRNETVAATADVDLLRGTRAA